MRDFSQLSGSRSLLSVVCGMVFAMASPQFAIAAQADISNKPLASTTAAQAKPNIMLLMDTSNSMKFTHMPDELEGTNGSYMPLGYKNFKCNVLYYNPNVTYALPKDATGNYLPAPNFNSASYNYYSTDTTAVDLAASFRAYDTATRQFQTIADPAQPAYYYTYSLASAMLSYASPPCTDIDTNVTKPASTGGTWTRVLVSSTSGPGATDERQNFANWYVYYRTRINLIKSAVSLSFTPLTDSYRVGLITVRPDLTGSDNYVPIADFDSTQRASWFSKLYAQVPGGSSPTREGLARVGRHYAGKSDGINTGMAGDPVQFSCQQNFTIMTTDGYWNVAAETAGPVKIDGVTLVGQQDGTLDGLDHNTSPGTVNVTPRPIWDGGPDSSRVVTDALKQYQAVACTSLYANVTTAQINRSTSQINKNTSQLTQSTAQVNQSTAQVNKSTSQLQRSTSQLTQSTSQLNKSTSQLSMSTSQLTRSTSQLQAQTLQHTQSTLQINKSTSQLQRSTSQLTNSTSQLTQSTSQLKKSTSQSTASTSQLTQSTSQLTTSTSQFNKSTSQLSRSTSQLTQTTSKTYMSTSQILSYNAATELTTPVASCTPSGNIYCSTATTGPTLVALCTPQAAGAGNLYTTTTCSTTIISGPAGVASCTPAAASSGNGYTTTACNTVTTGPTLVASCTAATAAAGNSYTATTCSNITTGPTPVASCTAVTASAGNSYTATTCNTVTTGPIGAASCTAASAAAGNSYTATTCNTVTTGPTGAASCAAAPAAAGNSYTATSCNTVTAGPTGVASCTAAAASAGNSYTATTCNTVTTGPTLVASCTAATASAGNSYTATTCANTTTGPTGVASCAAAVASAGNSYTATTCNTVTTGPTGVASCAAASAAAGNSYTATTCNTVTTGPTGAASCTAAPAAAGNSYTATTCNTATTGPTPAASCTAATATAGNSYTATTCNNVTTGPTPVASCTPVTAAAGNSYVATTCADVITATGVASCTPIAASAGNNWTATTCNTVTTGPTGVASCTAAAASAGNSYTATTCNTVTTGPTLVASCTAATASAGNSYTATTCANTTTGPTGVASCAAAVASAGNSYTATTCNTVTTGPTGVASCAAASAAAGNSYTATTCNTVTTGPTGAASCTAAPAAAGNSYTATTCNTATTGPTPAASCTAATATAGNSYTATTCNNVTTGPTPVASCTPVTAAAGNSYVATTCNTVITGPTGVASCAPVVATGGNNYTETACNTVTTGPTPAASCTVATASAGNSYKATTCNTVITGPTPAASCTSAAAAAGNSYTVTTCNTVTTPLGEAATCTPVAASAGNSYTATSCAYLAGSKAQSRIRTTTTTSSLSGSTVLSPPSTTIVDGAWSDVLPGVCVPNASTLILPLGSLPLDTRASASDATPPPGCSDWPCTVDTPIAGGSSNSLADVAQYYYVTDLRPFMVNDVPKTGTGPEDDKVDWQHMTTFAIALGVSGSLNYKDDYKTATTSADIAGIRSVPPTKAWPVWPDPAVDYVADAARYSDARSIDDFWHAAVNGRGQYFSAGNPDTVVNGLRTALAGINARLASASAAATSNLEPVAGDNFAYTAKYTTSAWVGELEAHSIDLASGAVSSTPIWSAQALLDTKANTSCDNRTVRLFRKGATDNLVDFSWNTKVCDSAGLPTGTAQTGLNASEQTNFVAANSVLFFSQYPNMTDGTFATVDQRTPAAGANLVNFIRGQRGLEGFASNDATKLYRTRAHILGDIVNAQPVYVKAPFSYYSDSGYDAFKTDNVGRDAMVYVGANDGMLHAFNAASGQEAWAFIPSFVLPNLYKLADDNYANNHAYSVDGSAAVGDIYDPGNLVAPVVAAQWKTILVGGLNAGGKAYYALDVTDPAAPKGLWEFNWSNTCYDEAAPSTHGSDCHLGYTFGKPVISKLQDGTWVVIVTSGYNNVNTPAKAGDGVGYVYVLNAVTGKIISKISTDVGDATTPSGLGQIINYVDNTVLNNMTLRVYGADMLGNVWRFDVNDNLLPAILIGTAKDSSGNPQPITTRPELAEVSGKPMVFVATGRLLGTTDLTDLSTQSVYGIVDPLNAGTSTVYPDLRGALKPLAMSQTGTGLSAYRTIACTAAPASCASTAGWVTDLPDSGERVNVDLKLQLGTLVFASNVPQNSACNIGGYSWINFMDFRTGNAVVTDANAAASRRLSASLAVGLNIVRLPNGKTVVIATTSDASQINLGLPVEIPPPVGKRVSWREILE